MSRQNTRKQADFLLSEKQMTYVVVLATVAAVLLAHILPQVWAFASDAITNGWEETINTGVGESIKDVFAQDGSIYEALVKNNKIIAPIYNVLAAIAAAMSVFLIYLNVIEEMLHGQDKVECFMRGLMKGIIIVILIMFSTRIVNALEDFGSGVYANVVDSVTDVVTDADSDIGFDSSIFSKKKNFAAFVTRILGTFFPYILAQISIVLAQVICYAIIVELTIRKMFFPLAIMNISVEGFRGPGLRWFRRYVALYIRMVIIYALGYINTVMVTIVTTSESLGSVQKAFGIVVVNFTIVSMMVKSSELANEVMGA